MQTTVVLLYVCTLCPVCTLRAFFALLAPSVHGCGNLYSLHTTVSEERTPILDHG